MACQPPRLALRPGMSALAFLDYLRQVYGAPVVVRRAGDGLRLLPIGWGDAVHHLRGWTLDRAGLRRLAP
jgi:hypothetical protein